MESSSSSGSLTSRLASRFSIHGLSNVLRSETNCRRAFWLSIFLLCVSVLLLQTGLLVHRYLQYQTVISAQLVRGQDVDFPVISICNLNRHKRSLVGHKLQEMFNDMRRAEISLNDFIKSVTTSTALPTTTTTTTTTTTATPTTTSNFTVFTKQTEKPLHIEPPFLEVKYSFPKALPSSPYDFFDLFPTDIDNNYADGDHHDQRYEVIRELHKKLEQDTPFADRANYSYDLEDMLLSCKWKFEDCGLENFTRYYSEIYGNCFSFMPEKELLVSKANANLRQGLRLELFIDVDEYIPYEIEELGTRVIIHSTGQHPLAVGNGVNISPGRATYLSLKSAHTRRQPAPYDTACISPSREDSRTMDGFVAHYPYIEYSAEGCLFTCYQQHLYKSCSCVLYGFPNTSLPFTGKQSEDGVPGCNYLDLDKIPCILGAREDWYGKRVHCDCQETCYQVDYDINSLSDTVWPTDSYSTIMASRIRETIGKPVNTSDVRNNVLKLNIYLEDTDYYLTEYKPATEFTNTIGEFGGSIGMCLGVSLVALFEILEFCIDLLANPDRIKPSAAVEPGSSQGNDLPHRRSRYGKPVSANTVMDMSNVDERKF